MSVSVTWNDPGPEVGLAAGRGLKAAAAVIQYEARQRAPMDQGDLRRSIETDADDREATVYADTPYAARQHEELTWKHTQGQAKYLETAFYDKQNEALEAMRDSIRGVF